MSSTAAAAAIRPSATLVLVRDAPSGPEVLLLRRDDRGDPTGGAWVFPGGLVDAADAEGGAQCVGVDDAAASATLGLADGGRAYLVAAIRECFEECGLLLAVDANGAAVEPARVAALQSWRAPLNAGTRSLAALLAETGLRLAADRLAYMAHWITPPGYRRRFDARFFVAAAPAGQPVQADGHEVLEHRWLRPADALAQQPPLKLMNPTRRTLALVGAHARVDAILAWARALPAVATIRPHAAVDADGPRPVNPDEPAYAEVRRLDPDGLAPPRCDIRPGLPVRLSPHVLRVTVDNGSVMTGPGTNSYLVGAGDAWAVVDPGPDDAAHLAAIQAAVPGRIRWILATHTHRDHSPGAAALQAATGATVLGRLPTHPDWQDTGFAPERELADGERLAVAPGVTLRVIHTPGHASNHLCFLLEEERTLFTGDHVMQGSTVVINPPDGDMAAYIASLRALLRDEAPRLDWLAPGHGFLMDAPGRAIEGLIAHRLRREAKVLAAVRAHADGAPAETLLAEVYADVAPRLHRAAMRSLEAHLLKLRHDGAADLRDDRWIATT